MNKVSGLVFLLASLAFQNIASAGDDFVLPKSDFKSFDEVMEREQKCYAVIASAAGSTSEAGGSPRSKSPDSLRASKEARDCIKPVLRWLFYYGISSYEREENEGADWHSVWVHIRELMTAMGYADYIGSPDLAQKSEQFCESMLKTDDMVLRADCFGELQLWWRWIATTYHRQTDPRPHLARLEKKQREWISKAEKSCEKQKTNNLVYRCFDDVEYWYFSHGYFQEGAEVGEKIFRREPNFDHFTDIIWTSISASGTRIFAARDPDFELTRQKFFQDADLRVQRAKRVAEIQGYAPDSPEAKMLVEKTLKSIGRVAEKLREQKIREMRAGKYGDFDDWTFRFFKNNFFKVKPESLLEIRQVYNLFYSEVVTSKDIGSDKSKALYFKFLPEILKMAEKNYPEKVFELGKMRKQLENAKTVEGRAIKNYPHFWYHPPKP